MISIIVPVYNVENYLCCCLDSLIGQTYQDLEIILVDDGSTDSSGKICEAYKSADPRIIVLHQKNQGVSAARNAGLRAAKGNFISFVDADDYLEPVMYETMLGRAEADQADIVICGAWFHTHDSKQSNRITGCKTDSDISASSALYNYLARNHYGRGLWNKLFKRTVVGEIRFDEDIYYFEDSLFFCRVLQALKLSKSGVLSLTPEPLYHYRAGRSGSSIQDFKKYQTSLEAAFRINKLLNVSESADQRLKDASLFKVSFMAVNCCRQALLHGYKKEARRYRALSKKYFFQTCFSTSIPVQYRIQVLFGLISPVHGVNLWLKIRG